MELTKGNIRRQMLTLCAPLVMGNILQQFYNTIDAWIIGRYSGDLPFAAIGIAGTAMNLYLFFIVGFCTGISVIFAQLYGAADLENFRREHFQMLVSGTVLAVLVALGGILLLNPLLAALGTPVSLFSYARSYLVIVLAGLPFSYLYNFYNALLRATGNVRAPLVILAAAVLANLAADIIFVRNLGIGVTGAAIATVLSQMLSVAANIVYMVRREQRLCFGRKDVGFSGNLVAKTFSVSLVTGIHQASLYLGKMFVQGAVNSAGEEMITAFTATTRIEGFINSFGDSGAAATSVIVAQSFGAGERKRVKAAVRTSGFILAVFGMVCSAGLFLLARPAVTFMLGRSSGEAWSQAVLYLEWIAGFYLFCFLGNTFAGYFDGIGKTVVPFIGAASHITLRAVLSWQWIGQMGLPAVALATGIGWVLADVFWLVMLVQMSKRRAAAPLRKPAGKLPARKLPAREA